MNLYSIYTKIYTELVIFGVLVLSVTFWLAFLVTFHLLKRIGAFGVRLPRARIHRVTAGARSRACEEPTEQMVSDAA